jgi:tRNA 2-selenouridine synthase
MASFRNVDITEALGRHEAILDVRSPAEYADDHMPGAINVPVLDDGERAHVGTLYLQSPFEAQRLGAVLIMRNIARHLGTTLNDKPRTWRPLVYCWRGGMRSGALAHILSEIGWKTARLVGGYKGYRHHVLTELETLPGQYRWQVVCGPTGSGKSRLLQALSVQGAQVLDLEQLAQHRGSLLGSLPGQPQPAQRLFETRIWDTLRRFDPQRPVFVEAESRMVGCVRVPSELLGCMRAASCIAIEAPLAERVELLLEDYAHFLRDPAALQQRLELLLELHGRKVIEAWMALAAAGAWPELVRALLEQHYDPAYRKSSGVSFEQLDRAAVLPIERLDDAGIQVAAARCLELNKESI